MPGPLHIFQLKNSDQAESLLQWCRLPENRARMITTTNFGTAEHFVVIEDTLGVSPSPLAQAREYWGDQITETDWPE